MARKEWEGVIGNPSVNPEDGDSLLQQSRSDRERKRIKRQEDEEQATHEARMAELHKKTVTSDAAVEKSEEKKEESGGIKINAKMDIDLDAERKEAKEAAEKLRKELADNANRTSQENNQLRQQLHEAEMREIKATNEAAIALISDKIDGRSPVEIIADIRNMAAELGLKAPDPGISDPALQLQVIQLQNAEAARAREFEWKMQQDKFEREDRKEERVDNRAFKAAEFQQRAKRDEMFANAPAVIGGAIAKGLMETGGGGVSGAPKGKAGQSVEAGVGESGEFECSSCRQPVAIGPTAKSAVCSNCGARFSIKRMEPEATPEEE